MFNTFNMGVGMSLVVAPDTLDLAINALRESGENPYVIGEITTGDEKIALC